MKQFIFGNIRICILSDGIVRLERAKRGAFCDENTFFVPNKTDYAATEVFAVEEEGVVCFGEYELYVPNGNGLTGVRLEKNGVRVYSHKKIGRSDELPPVDKTPAVFAFSDTPRIVLPEDGYSYHGKRKMSGFKIEENVQDVYLLLCDGDPALLRKLYYGLTGTKQLMPLSAFGSRIIAESRDAARRILADGEELGLPLDQMIVDGNGAQENVDEERLADIKDFLGFAHGRGVAVGFVDRPEPVEGADTLLSSVEVRYREKSMRTMMKLGLDFWAYDGNEKSRLVSPVDGINSDIFVPYILREITRGYCRRSACGKECRRPYITDCVRDAPCAATPPADGGNAAYLRRVQMSALSERFYFETPPRDSGWDVSDIAGEYVNMRYRLLPVIYRNAYESYRSGAPVFKPLIWEYPADKRALKCTDEYMLGNDILVVPITGAAQSEEREIYFPEGKWMDVFDGKIYEGRRIVRKAYDVRSMPLFVRLGALLPLAYDAVNTKKQRWSKLVYDFYPVRYGSDSGYLYEDDGETAAYRRGQYRTSAYATRYDEAGNAFVIDLHAAQGGFAGDRAYAERDVKIKYHLLKGVDKVRMIRINGEPVAFEEEKKDAEAFPFNTGKTAPDYGAVTVRFDVETDRDYEIVFYL